MLPRVKEFIELESNLQLIDNNQYEQLFEVAYKHMLLNNTEMSQLVSVLEQALDINLKPIQEKCFLSRFRNNKFPDKYLYKEYYTYDGGLRLRAYLTNSIYFLNLYGLLVDDAVNALIEADYNVESTPDYGWVLY